MLLALQTFSSIACRHSPPLPFSFPPPFFANLFSYLEFFLCTVLYIDCRAMIDMLSCEGLITCSLWPFRWKSSCEHLVLALTGLSTAV